MTAGTLTVALTITLWHAYAQGPEQEGLDQAVAAVNRELQAEGSTERLEVLATAYDVFHKKLETAIPRGHGPDLFIAAHDRLGDWRRVGLVAPLRPDAGDRDAYLGGLLEALSDEQGEPWALPWTYKGLVLYWNRRLLPAAPRDLDDVVALQARLPEGSFALAYDATSLFSHSPFLLGMGGAVFTEPDADGRVRYRIFDERARASYALVRDLRRAGAIPSETSYVLAQRLFDREQAAVVISGPWFAGGIALDRARWDVAPLFSIHGHAAGSFVTVEGLFLAAGSPHEAAAADVARRLAKHWRPRTDVGGQAPVYRSAYDEPLPPLVQAQRTALANGRATPARREMSWVWEPLKGLLGGVLDHGVPLDDAVRRAEHRLRVLSRRSPDPVDPTPYLIALGLAAAVVLGLATRRLVDPALRVRLRAARPAYLLSGPAVLAMVVLVVMPFVAGSALSVFAHADGEYTFIGLGNFRDILFARDYPITDPLSFWFTLAVTLAWTGANVAMHVGIGIALALLLRGSWLKLRGVYRVLLILPWAVPSYITALVWRGLFDFQLGAINGLLRGLSLEPVGWFQSFAPAFAANVTTNTWLGFPFMMVVALGALQGMPAELEEVARLEGAGRWQTFRWVVWPSIRPALIPAVLLGTVWTFNMFNVIYLVSGGEPGGSTEILITEAYKWAFERQYRYGYAAAYAVIIFGILLVYGRVLLRRGGDGR